MYLVYWLSNKQPMIETYAFGADFVALKHVMEALYGIRYKIRMIGVPLYGYSYVYGNNTSVIQNTPRPESTLRNELNSIFYHAVRESM